jgi:WD40 repeat protein
MNATEMRMESPFYVAGGTLSRDALSYVTRQADRQLYDGLSRSQFSYVLTARQMGKSSLMVRTASRLRDEGAGVVVLDLTAIGQNLTAEQWYEGLLTQIGQQLNLEGELEEFWDGHPGLGPLQRWMQALTRVVLPRYPGRVEVFIDEIDAVRSLPFSTDEFFAGLREFYNRRTEDPELERLSFCLLGVAAPSDLIRDTRMTPFNIGRRIEMHDFTEAEAHVLAVGLAADERQGAALLNRILYWTGGHPYLTQRLCQAAAEQKAASAGDVDRLCDELYFARRAREQDDNLLFVRERMLRSEVDVAGLLNLYGRVRKGKKVEDDETNPFVTILKLSGIARVEDGRLRVRNRIYERVFDQEWIEANMPDAEIRRQRAAYRKGLMRAAAIAAVILAAIASLAFVAIRQRNIARAAEETNRRQLYAAQMALAEQAWEDAGVARMLDLLNNHIPKPGQEDLRGFEWYHLWGLGHSELRSFRHGNVMVPVVFFPDNRRVATGGSDGTVKVWDVVTGEQLMTLAGHSGQVASVAVSPDGRTLASAGADKTARVWDALTGREIVTLGAHAEFVNQVAFSPDGNMLATASEDKTVKLWNASTWRELAALIHPAQVMVVAFSPEGGTLATGCHDSVVRLWDTRSGKELRSFNVGSSVYALAVSPDGATLVTGRVSGLVQFWDVATARPVLAKAAISGQPPAPKTIMAGSGAGGLRFSADGKTLAIASADRTAKLYSSDDLKLLQTFKGHGVRVKFLAFSGNGRLLATGGGDGVAKLWDVGDPQEPSLLLPGGIPKIAISPDGCRLATAEIDQSAVRLWDLKTLKELRSFEWHKGGGVLAVASSPDGRNLATGRDDGIVKLWDVSTGQETVTFKGHTGRIRGADFSPDGRYLATAGEGADNTLWDATTGQEIASLVQPVRTLWPFSPPLRFSRDGRFIAFGSDDKVRLWDVNTRQEALVLTLPQVVTAIAFSPDGKTLAAGLFDGQVALWDLSTSRERLTLKGHDGFAYCLEFFPDGRRLASGGGDNTVKIWDVATGQELISFRHQNRVMDLAISSDGRIMASGANPVRLRFAVDPAASEEAKTERLRNLIAASN